jgi:hypothetical protein
VSWFPIFGFKSLHPNMLPFLLVLHVRYAACILRRDGRDDGGEGMGNYNDEWILQVTKKKLLSWGA